MAGDRENPARRESPAQAAGADARALAMRAVAKWLRSGAFPSSTFPDAPPDAVQIIQGVLRNYTALEFAFLKFCNRRPDESARAALAVGAWQLLFSEKTPDYAAVGETVEAARSSHAAAPGFVNAVLRNMLRRRDGILAAIAAAPLHVRTSHPERLVGRWRAAFGDAETERICVCDNEVPPICAVPLPFNAPCARDELLALWREAGIGAAPHPSSPEAVLVPHGTRIDRLPGYAEGRFVIQDPATLLSVKLLDPRPGETVFDCCAAPGGKTLQIASIVGAAGRVVAADNSEQRIERLRENIARAGMGGIVDARLLDASAPPPDDLFGGRPPDAVLADVPCSNSGVLRRRPEARRRWSEGETARLAALQLQILRNVSRLSPGRIVYSTCSIDPEEDEEVAARFLSSEEGSRYIQAKSVKLLPDSASDGAFATLLVRRPDAP